MTEVTATEASRRFADLLDGVEHRGERYTIVRRGRVIAQLEPVMPVPRPRHFYADIESTGHGATKSKRCEMT